MPYNVTYKTKIKQCPAGIFVQGYAVLPGYVTDTQGWIRSTGFSEVGDIEQARLEMNNETKRHIGQLRRRIAKLHQELELLEGHLEANPEPIVQL